MPTVLKTALVHRPAARPRRRARVDVDYHGLTSPFATVNRKQSTRRMDLELVEGPFDHFKGHWSGHIIETLVDRFVVRAQSR
jgi:ribosome-associated toxin RatA of RatAB toxin-antitoxin module